MSRRVLVTGSMGVVGAALASALARRGDEVVQVDLRCADNIGCRDILDSPRLVQSLAGCDGVVHLAAVSRVEWGETDPERCRLVNVDGTEMVLQAALASRRRPWVLFASSREVYGPSGHHPVTEDALLAPVNVYGRSKVVGEQRVNAARQRGLATAVVRLSNVYGSLTDHLDRAVPAFVRAAAAGGRLRVDGGHKAMDFTHIHDVVAGLLSVVDLLFAGESPPPIHLLTGETTSLASLAALAVDLAGTGATIVDAPSRSFEVSLFQGDPSRARDLIGWRSTIPLREGIARLISDLRRSEAWSNGTQLEHTEPGGGK